MLTHPTHGRLVTLGLTGRAKALDEQQRQPDIATLAFEERLALLVDREATERENKRLVSRLRFASLRQNAVVEDIDMKRERYQNLLIIGPTGVGKSWIACALGHRPVGITARSSINAYRDCSMCSRLHAATAITPGSSKAWRGSSF
jgi:DNA replication protein DnaC